MNGQPDPSSKLPFVLVAIGVLSVLSISLALRIFSQRSEGDAFFVSPEYQNYQTSLASQRMRRQVVEEFVTATVNCLTSPMVPGQSLIEEELDGRVARALDKLSGSDESGDAACRKSRAWTFSPPCQLTIESAAFGLGSAHKLGDITLCVSTITANLHAHAGPCASSANFKTCLVQSILADETVRRAVDDTGVGTPRTQ
ncbi:MAG: hypothetical protein FWC84_02800 [Alphaproteobacteria bacterium]|nr:hypothetical protein [Alphaproteobacteria bacterium]